LVRDKHGEIVINKLDEYIEPTKGVREARGDVRLQNNYNFGDLSVDKSEDEEDEEEEESEEEVETQEQQKKKKQKVEKKGNADDLDDLLKEFGGR
jgi:hypothetical protein